MTPEATKNLNDFFALLFEADQENKQCKVLAIRLIKAIEARIATEAKIL